MARRQSGFTLAETLVAVALLGIAILMAAAIVTWALRVDSKAQARMLGLDVASSVAELVRAAPYESIESGEIDPGSLAPTQLKDLHVTLDVDEDPAASVKAVAIQVAWGGPSAGQLVLDTAVGRQGTYQ